MATSRPRRVSRAVHFPHPARAQRRYDFVRTKFSTRTEHSDLSLHSGISPAAPRAAAPAERLNFAHLAPCKGRYDRVVS